MFYNYHAFPPLPIPPNEIVNAHGPYKEKKEAMAKLPRIYKHPNYCIDRNGVVYDYATGKHVEPISEDEIILDNTKLKIDYLLLWAFVGVSDLPVVPRSTYPKSSQYVGRRCSSLTYLVRASDVKEPKDDSGIYLINQEPYKKIPNVKRIIVINQMGCIYDVTADDFVMRIFYARSPYVMMDPTEEFIEKTKKKNLNVWNVRSLLRDAWPENHRDEEIFSPFPLKNASGEIIRTDNQLSYDQIETIAKMLGEHAKKWEIAKAIGYDCSTEMQRKRLGQILYKVGKQPGYYEKLKEKYHLG